MFKVADNTHYATSGGEMSYENLRQWEKAIAVKVVKPPRYRSKFNPKTPPCYSTFTKNVPTEIQPDQLPKRKPGIPRGNDPKAVPVHGLKTNKNFVVSNAVQVITNSSPSATAINKQTTRYVNKKNYGKSPEYLKDIKQQIEEEKEVLRDFMQHIVTDNNDNDEEQQRGEQLPEQDRLNLLKQLKRKWGATNREFQKIIDCSSNTKMRLKENLERQLKAIEQDIQLLSRSNYVQII